MFADLVLDDLGEGDVILAERDPIVLSLHLRPIDGSVACEYAQAAAWWQLLIYLADRRQPLAINRRLPSSHFGRIAPHTAQLIGRNIPAGNVSIENALVVPAAEFDNNVVYL